MSENPLVIDIPFLQKERDSLTKQLSEQAANLSRVQGAIMLVDNLLTQLKNGNNSNGNTSNP